MAAVLLMIFNILPTFGGISVSNAQSNSYITYNIDTKENVFNIGFDNSEIKNFCKDFKNKNKF